MAESKSYPLIVEYRRSMSALQGSTMPRELFVFSIGSPQRERERVWEVCRTHSQITPSYIKMMVVVFFVVVVVSILVVVYCR